MHRIQSDLDLEIFIPAGDVIWWFRAWIFWIVVEVCCVQGIFYLKIRFYFGNALYSVISYAISCVCTTTIMHCVRLVRSDIPVYEV